MNQRAIILALIPQSYHRLLFVWALPKKMECNALIMYTRQPTQLENHAQYLGNRSTIGGMLDKNVVLNSRVLLVSDGLAHPSWPARRWLKRSLQAMSGYVFQQVASLEVLPQLDVSTFKAIVLYFHHKTISPSALSCLDEFVRRGGGVLGIHSATASFKQEPRYFGILGGRFRMHGAVQVFTVYQTRTTDKVFGSLGPFQIKDELYIHELEPEITIHFETMHEGQSVPVVWTRRYGAGQVCYAMPGHTVESMKHPMVHDILRRGLMWVCRS